MCLPATLAGARSEAGAEAARGKADLAPASDARPPRGVAPVGTPPPPSPPPLTPSSRPRRHGPPVLHSPSAPSPPRLAPPAPPHRPRPPRSSPRLDSRAAMAPLPSSRRVALAVAAALVAVVIGAQGAGAGHSGRLAHQS